MSTEKVTAEFSREDIEEALAILVFTEDAEQAHLNCPECNGELQPELCEECFPAADEIRCRRRTLLTKLGLNNG